MDPDERPDFARKQAAGQARLLRDMAEAKERFECAKQKFDLAAVIAHDVQRDQTALPHPSRLPKNLAHASMVYRVAVKRFTEFLLDERIPPDTGEG
jgi:hypothetical protein